MQRYFIQLSYDGTNYHGWQIQPNAISVQEIVEKALSTILRETISVTGAGRTDTGVHATFYVVHFESENHAIDGDKLAYRLNSFLPHDVAIQAVYPVPAQAHARFDATYRTYNYLISKRKDPFSFPFAHTHNRPLDVAKMNEAAQTLFEYRDFTSFSRLGTDVKTNICTIYEARWIEEETQLKFVVKADRFLRNMVRAIVGTLLLVGQNKLTIDGFRAIIEAEDRGAAGASAAAKGLFLVDVGYPEEMSNGLIRPESD